MLRSLYLLLLVLPTFTGHTQVLIESLPVPAIGDSIVNYVNLNVDIDISDSGVDASWNWVLEDTLASVTNYYANDDEVTFPTANRKVGGPVFSQYVSMTGTSWYQVGGSGQDPIGFGFAVQTVLEPGLTELYAPLAYGDTVEQSADSYTGIPLVFIPDSILQLLPVVPDTVRVVVGLDRTDIVDAYGTLTLNGEPYSIARMSRTEMYDARVEAKVSILPWVDVTDLLLQFLPAGVALKDTTLSQRYIANGVAYPLVTVFLDDEGMPQNTEHTTDVISRVHEVTLQEVTIAPNPARGLITISLDGSPGKTYHAALFRSSGEQAAEFVLQRGQSVQDLSFLPPGAYILTVYQDNGRITGSGKVVLIGR